MGDAEFPKRDEIHDMTSQDIAQGLHLSTSAYPLLSSTGGQQDIFICDSVVNVNSFVMAPVYINLALYFWFSNSSVMLETLWKPPMLIQIENANCQAPTPEIFSI